MQMPERYPLRRDGAQTVEEMAEQMRQNKEQQKVRRGRKLYNEVSSELKAETLASIITQQRQAVSKMGVDGQIHRVDLKDLAAVRDATVAYLEACQLASVIPSISGLSASFGYSRQWVCKIAGEQTEVGIFLSAVFASISSCLEQMSLMRQTDPATSIFLMKNGAVGMTDTHTIQATPTSAEPEREITRDQLELWFSEEVDQHDDADD